MNRLRDFLNSRLCAQLIHVAGWVMSWLFVIILARSADPGVPANWDWLLVTGFFFVMTGIVLARRLPRRLSVTVLRLIDRGVIDAADNRELLLDNLERKARKLSQWGGLAFAVIIAGAFVVADDTDAVLTRAQIPLAVFSTAWGYVAGRYVGRMFSYGLLASSLNAENVSWRAIPGHLDGAAGLKPIGDFYLLQAAIAGLPAVFFGLWLLIIPHWGGRDYQRWVEPYSGMLFIGLGIEVSSFLAPLWSFHKQMQRQKADLLGEADKLSIQIGELENDLNKVQSDLRRPYYLHDRAADEKILGY